MVDDSGLATTGNIQWQGEWGGIVQMERNNNMAIFFNKAVHSPAKSTEKGSPHYDNVVFVRIAPPGERLNIVERPARDEDRRRFAVQWAQFQQNQQQLPEGMPIDLLYPEQPAVAATLRAHGVYTIEQCSALSGPAIDNIGMGAQQYCNDAVKMLEMANKGVSAVKHRKDLEDRDQKIRILENTIHQLQATVGRLETQSAAAPNLEQIQTLLAGLQQRPVHLPGQGFDSQLSAINANHGSALEAADRTPRQRVRARAK